MKILVALEEVKSFFNDVEMEISWIPLMTRFSNMFGKYNLYN